MENHLAGPQDVWVQCCFYQVGWAMHLYGLILYPFKWIPFWVFKTDKRSSPRWPFVSTLIHHRIGGSLSYAYSGGNLGRLHGIQLGRGVPAILLLFLPMISLFLAAPPGKLLRFFRLVYTNMAAGRGNILILENPLSLSAAMWVLLQTILFALYCIFLIKTMSRNIWGFRRC